MFESVIENEVDFQESNRIIEKIRFSLKLDLCRDRVRRRFSKRGPRATAVKSLIP